MSPARARLWIGLAGAALLAVLTSAAVGRVAPAPDLSAVALALLLAVPAALAGMAIGVLARTPVRAVGWLCALALALAACAGAGCCSA